MSDPQPVVIPIRADTSQMEDDIASAGERAGAQGGENASKALSKNLTKAGVAVAAGGAGLEAFARSSQNATLALTRISVSTGQPVGALRDLAAATSNAGFEVDEVIPTFEALGKQGVTNTDDLKRVANVWDSVADATGGSAPALAEAANSLQAFGISAKNPEKALDALGTVAFHTKDGIDGFTSFLQKNGPKLAGYGLSVDDIAASLVALDKKGLSGRKGQAAFSAAIKASNGNVKEALKTLGVSGPEYDKFRASVKNGSEELNRSAAAADNVLTPMQKLHAWFQQLILRSGKFGVIAGQIAPILIGLGGGLAAAGKAAAFFDTSVGKKLVETLKKTALALKLSNIQATLMAAKARILAIATKAWAIAQRILNLVMRANPLILIVTLLIALGAALVVAYKKSETFRKFVQAAFAIIKSVISSVVNFIIKTVPAAFQKIIDGVTKAWNAVVSFFSGLARKVIAFFSGAATWLLKAGKAIINGLWTGIKAVWAALWFWYVTIPSKLIGFFVNAITWLVNAGKRILRGLWDGLKAVWSSIASWFRTLGTWILSVFANAATWLINAGKRILQGLWSGLRAVWTTVSGWLSSLGSRIIGAFRAAGSWLLGVGRSIMSGLWNGLRAVWSNSIGWLSGIGGKLISAFKGAGRWLFNTGKAIMRGLWDGLLSLASEGLGIGANIGKAIVNFIIDGLNNILDLPWELHIPLPVVPDIGPFTILPHIPRLRDGGLINGPGTGRSDSVPLMGSDGEYMVNAKATKEWLPLLEAINWGKSLPPSWAAALGGGEGVTVSPPSATVLDVPAAGQTVVNQNYYGPTTSAGRRRELEWTLKYATT